MSSPRVEVMLWARRTVAKKTAEPHQILDIRPDATVDEAQEAFHKLARVAHPDLHRTTITPEDLEIVTTAYAMAAGAYQAFRNPSSQKPAKTTPPDTRAKRPSTIHLPGGGVVRTTGATRPPISTTSTPVTKPATSPPPPSAGPAPAASDAPTTPTSPATQMNGKALVQYRKAELALRHGDVRTGLLHLKMAIGADPGSTFLRAALAEVEAELAK